MKKTKKQQSKLMPFIDNKGKVVLLPNSLTMDDLVRMGITVKLQTKDEPIRDGWFIHTP